MTLKKLHLKENGWFVLLFFEPIEEAMRAEVLELPTSVVGSQSFARLLSAEETTMLQKVCGAPEAFHAWLQKAC